MLRRLLITMFILLCTLGSSLRADEGLEDVVYLKNGSVIRGILVEQVPGVSVTIQTRDGSKFVYDMSEVSRITKEPRLMAAGRQAAGITSATVVSVNPLGLAGLGISWIGLERYLAPYMAYQARLDLWNYDEREEDGGYSYDETQTGFGAGLSVRAYMPSSQSLSGLFGAFGADAVYTKWKWEERVSSNSKPTNGNGTTLTTVVHAQVGYAIPISNVRIEPSVVAGYFVLREEGAGVAGVAVMPAVQFGIAF